MLLLLPYQVETDSRRHSNEARVEATASSPVARSAGFFDPWELPMFLSGGGPRRGSKKQQNDAVHSTGPAAQERRDRGLWRGTELAMAGLLFACDGCAEKAMPGHFNSHIVNIT